MKIILDTNVFISGVLFGGLPGRIIDAWACKALDLVLSPEILEEYLRVAAQLGGSHGVDLKTVILRLLTRSAIYDVPSLPEPICTDADDDKFIALALFSRVPTIISGDRALKQCTGHKGVQVMSPREFIARHLESK